MSSVPLRNYKNKNRPRIYIYGLKILIKKIIEFNWAHEPSYKFNELICNIQDTIIFYYLMFFLLLNFFWKYNFIICYRWFFFLAQT